ncbi:MAG: hypothetical protein LBK99_15755 [Opitutaceae bacterium]|jgi:hypothetical protein|nr:hypothetical protein [Opitutaceae bacterium]
MHFIRMDANDFAPPPPAPSPAPLPPTPEEERQARRARLVIWLFMVVNIVVIGLLFWRRHLAGR